MSVGKSSGLAPCALFVGGVRSGKSALAQQWAEAQADRRVFVATCAATDAEMQERVRRHQAARGPGWSCLEAPLELEAALDALWAEANGPQASGPDKARQGVILLDCASMWLANLLALGLDDQALLRRVESLAASLERRTLPVAVVTAEAGLGLVPPSPLGRRFLDLLGLANQLLAQAAEPVIFVSCGLALPLRGLLPLELESRP